MTAPTCYDVRVMRVLGVLGVAVFAVAAGGCECDGAAVPFGLDAGAEVAHEGQPNRPGREGSPPITRAFPDGTPRVEMEGAPLQVEGSIRGLWAHDVDADGDRDAIVLAAGPDAALRLAFARREGARFEALQDLSHAPPAAGCTVEGPTFEPLGRWLLARANVACPESPASARQELWVITTERTPRVLEHLAILDAHGRAPGRVTLALAAEDRDDDGHDDLVVSVSVESGGSSTSIVLPWLDRPSGLARDAAEPERTFGERAREGLRALRREPERALSLSREVVALHAVLCREPGQPRVRVGRTDGLSCGSSEGAGRAATTVVRALAAKGELLEALGAIEHLETPGLVVDDERRQAVKNAIGGAPATAGVTLREGPALLAPTTPALRLSALAFLDEDRLLLRGERPHIYTISTGELMEAEPAQAELRVLDPAGTFAVAGIERRCEGHVLRIVPARAFVMGQVLGSTHSSPLLAEREPPADAPCPDLTPNLRIDDGGFHVLGWAPQGVVAARAGQLSVVPLDVSAQAAGPPELLGAGTPPPAPLPAGAITADGRFFAEVRGLGVLVHPVASSGGPQLFWPEGWGAREGAVTDPAVSPSGHRVGVIRGGQVLILERTH